MRCPAGVSHAAAGPLAVFGVLALTSGCDILSGHDCTQEVVPGLVLEIVDAATGAWVADSAHTEIRDGDYRHTLEGCAFDGATMTSRCGAYERPGRYSISVAQPKFEAWADEVEVKDGECHVRRQDVRVELVAR